MDRLQSYGHVAKLLHREDAARNPRLHTAVTNRRRVGSVLYRSFNGARSTRTAGVLSSDRGKHLYFGGRLNYGVWKHPHQQSNQDLGA